ncbi:Nanos 1 isoform 2 [Schistosoma japonicum]|uniref:Nanos 1 isoform 2 n=3 Tax=Schistosoma japonicum TaxID=6182 RepID=A0A4Z2D388_SCHJA|nr:Nanos 1 isoform 2 [Schistosoma japonicum]
MNILVFLKQRFRVRVPVQRHSHKRGPINASHESSRMIDFRRTPCCDLWSTQDFQTLDAGVARRGCESPITCGVTHQPSHGNKDLMTSIDNSNCEISGEKHKASPLDDGYKWHLRTGASQCCAWGDFSLRDAIGTALVILNSISKTGFRRITNRSHRNKEWDRDTLKLHSWFSAICLLEMPASLRQVFLSVRRKLEEDYVLCAFCRNNGEPPDIYITHEVRDQDGRVTCPVLRVLSCPNCHATGDRAHTIKYCPHPRQF